VPHPVPTVLGRRGHLLPGWHRRCCCSWSHASCWAGGCTPRPSTTLLPPHAPEHTHTHTHTLY
jgi:hypothetical protein